MTKIVRLKKQPPVAKDELDRQAVCRAIVTIHGEGRYYEGMDLLCRVVGWAPLVRGFHPAEEMDAWANEMRGAFDDHPKKPNRAKSKMCGTCGRRHDPERIYKRKPKTTPVCRECGRRHNKKESA